jgi:hypothetical protein
VVPVPDLLVQVYPGNVLNTYHWRPAAVDRVAVWRGWYTEGGLESDLITKLAQQDRWTTVDEDIRLVGSVQRGLGSRGYRPGPLITDPRCGVSSEHSVKALHDWIRTALHVLQASNAASPGTLPAGSEGRSIPCPDMTARCGRWHIVRMANTWSPAATIRRSGYGT